MSELSEEHRAKISAAGIGQVRSDETREKIRQARLGTVLSDEHKERLRVAALRRWAVQRGEDPDKAVAAAYQDGVPLPRPKKRSSSSSSARKPSAVAQFAGETVKVMLSDGRIVTAPAGDPVTRIMFRILQARGLGEEPEAADFAAVTSWADDLARKTARAAAKIKGPRFIDCQGFAGGFTLGASQAGYVLTHKVEEPEGFGMAMCEANRGLLGDFWDAQAAPPETWEVPSGGAELVVGNPPCSGFSVMSPKSFRGIDSTINQCMKNLFAYAARVKPRAVVMESVGSAYTIGLPLMRQLAAGFSESTGKKHYVTHVLQNNLSLGGCTRRRRYFLVVTDCPFGVEREPLKWLPVLGDALSDLKDMPLSWDEQPYNAPPTWWSLRHRSVTGVTDGHQVPVLTRLNQERLTDITGSVSWEPGEPFDAVLKRYYETHGEMPESWRYPSGAKGMEHLTRDKVMIDRDFKTGGYSQTRQWRWDEPGNVMTGHGPTQVWHPAGRHLTHRESARVMGFPDDWKIAPLAGDPNLTAMWGKGISVDCGRWICTWIRESLAGRPGSLSGDDLPGDYGDKVIDVTADWKLAPRGVIVTEFLSQDTADTADTAEALEEIAGEIATETVAAE